MKTSFYVLTLVTFSFASACDSGKPPSYTMGEKKEFSSNATGDETSSKATQTTSTTPSEATPAAASAPAAKAIATPLGTFRTACYTPAGGSPTTIDATWSPNHLSTLVKIYSDAQCTSTPQTLSFEHDYTLAGPSTVIEGAVNYNLSYKGTNNQTGETISAVAFSIFKIVDADTVAVGGADALGNDGTTIEKRYKILDPNIIYKRLK